MRITPQHETPQKEANLTPADPTDTLAPPSYEEAVKSVSTPIHPQKKLPVSVVLTAYNEAHNLPRCLNSVKDWASQIVAVINDNCTDDTEAVLKSYGAKIVKRPYDTLPEHKNAALEAADEPWVFNLDCDEELSPALIREIHTFIEANDPKFTGASMPRKTWFLGRWIRHGDWYPDVVVRIVRNGAGRFVGGSYHCHMEIDGPVCALKGNLFHYSFPTLDLMISKYAPFGRAFVQDKLKSGKRFTPAKALLRGFWRFFRAYVLRAGFLDGFPGLYIALNQGFNAVYRWSLLHELEIKDRKAAPEAEDL